MKPKLPDEIAINLPVTRKELIWHAGTKCSTYERGCYTCMAWRSWEKTGKIKQYLRRRDILGLEWYGVDTQYADLFKSIDMMKKLGTVGRAALEKRKKRAKPTT